MIDADKQILVVFATPVIDTCERERLTIAGAPTRINVDDKVASPRHGLEIRVKHVAILPMRTTMNFEHRGIAPGGIEARRL